MTERILPNEHYAEPRDLGFISGRKEMLLWRSQFGDAWRGRHFQLAQSPTEDLWEIDDFPLPMQEILRKVAIDQKKKHPSKYRRVHAKIDVRFFDRDYITDHDGASVDPATITPEPRNMAAVVHFDDVFGQPENNTLDVYLWASEQSSSTAVLSGTLSSSDINVFTTGTSETVEESLLSRPHLIAFSALPGHLIATDKFTPHAQPHRRVIRDGIPRVFIRVHTWLE